jgi:channel protein (hemolysin III family)
VSALYHRVTWTIPARPRMRRLDHAMIFLLIAGTYTPVGLLVPGPGRPGGWGGRCTWPLVGWRWWPCRSCSSASGWPVGC